MTLRISLRRAVAGFASLTLPCMAGEFHVSTTGDDGRDGVSPATAWRTITRAAEAMKPGDVCVIGGGTFRETGVPRADGLTFRAAEGADVVVSGCDPLANWQPHTGAVHRAGVTAKVLEVFENGRRMNPARHPNEDGDPLSAGEWAAATMKFVSRDGGGKAEVSFAGKGWPAGHWDGAYYCGLHGRNFYQPIFGRVVATRGTALTLDGLSGALLTNPPEFSGDGRGYLIHHLNALDAPSEWHWQDDALYFQSSDGAKPGSKTVEARTRLWGFDLSGRKNIRIEGLRFFACSVLMDGSDACEISRCEFRHHSPWGAFREDFRQPGERGWFSYGAKEDGTAGVFVRGAGNLISRCSFRDFWGQGVHFREGRGNVVEHCKFENFNWLALQDGAAVFLNGEGHEVRHCRIRQCAAMGIAGKQVGPHLVHGVKVLHCDIADTGRLLLDGGQSAIYFNNHNAPTAERRLDGEIAWNRIGIVHGLSDNGKGMGIYLDDGTDFARVHHNLLRCGPKVRWPIFLHAGGHAFDDTQVHHNLIAGVPANDARAAAIVTVPRPKAGSIRGVTVTANITTAAEVVKVLHGTAEGITASENVTSADARAFEVAEREWESQRKGADAR